MNVEKAAPSPKISDEAPPLSPGWLAVALLFFCHIYFSQMYPNFNGTNEYSRLLLVSAIVDDGSIQIDHAITRWGDCEDKSYYNGHYYSDKAIGVALLGVPIYFLARLIPVHWPPNLLIFLLRTICITLPSLLFLKPLGRFWQTINPDPAVVARCILVFLFGTIAFTYSMQFIAQQLVGALLFLSFYLIWSKPTPSRLLIAGAFSGMAVLSEYPALFAVAILAVYAAVKLRGRSLWFVAGTLPFAALLLGYNFMIFGTPFDVTYRHMAGQAQVAEHAKGLIGLGLLQPEAIYGQLFSSRRGLFFYSPVLLMALPGFYFFARIARWKAEAWLFAALSLCYLLVYSSAAPWDFGWVLGPRFLTPALPFLMTAVFVAMSHPWFSGGVGRFLMLLLSLVSIMMVTVGTITFPFPSSEMRDPFFLLSLPLFLHGAYSQNLGTLLFHLASVGPAILFCFLIFAAYIAMIAKQEQIKSPTLQQWKAPILAFVLALIVLFSGYRLAPEPTAFELYARASAYYFLGEYYLCADELRAALQQNPDPHIKELIRQRAWQVAIRPEFNGHLPRHQP